MPKGKWGETDHNWSMTIRLDANLHERFKRCCAEDDVSMSEAVRRFIRAYTEGRHEEVGQLTANLAENKLDAADPREWTREGQ